MNFDKPSDFLAIGLLHPIRAGDESGVERGPCGGGAVAGELDRGTMELLMSQPVPRNRLILAHFLVDCLTLPVLCLSFFAGTEFGLWAVGRLRTGLLDAQRGRERIDLHENHSSRSPPKDPPPLEVSGRGEIDRPGEHARARCSRSAE